MSHTALVKKVMNSLSGCGCCSDYSSDERVIADAIAEATRDAIQDLWKQIRHWYPHMHFCPDWDFLLIHYRDPEFAHCTCERFQGAQP